jgi:hypothetical protein
VEQGRRQQNGVPLLIMITMASVSIWFRFVLAVLATWRVTHLLANEDGPADVIVRVRLWLGDRLIGKLMDCFNCLSLWIAAPAALFVSRRPMDWFVSWLALSGAACLLERLGESPVVVESISELEEGGPDHVLRKETHDDSDGNTNDARHGKLNRDGSQRTLAENPSSVH